MKSPTPLQRPVCYERFPADDHRGCHTEEEISGYGVHDMSFWTYCAESGGSCKADNSNYGVESVIKVNGRMEQGFCRIVC